MKKGFTLIELLGVIILLGVLSLIATVTVNNTIKENRKKACNIQLQNIIDGAKTWASKNPYSLPSHEGDVYTLTLSDLKQAGMIDKDIKNPISDELFSNDITVTIKRIDNNYKYTISEEC